jgi:hypothetical protein
LVPATTAPSDASSPLSPKTQDHVKPKTASNLAYLGQTLVRILPIAQDEHISAYDTTTWSKTVRISRTVRQPHVTRSPIAASAAGSSPYFPRRIRRICRLGIELHLPIPDLFRVNT